MRYNCYTLDTPMYSFAFPSYRVTKVTLQCDSSIDYKLTVQGEIFPGSAVYVSIEPLLMLQLELVQMP